jgi:hypothetical protein
MLCAIQDHLYGSGIRRLTIIILHTRLVLLLCCVRHLLCHAVCHTEYLYGSGVCVGVYPIPPLSVVSALKAPRGWFNLGVPAWLSHQVLFPRALRPERVPFCFLLVTEYRIVTSRTICLITTWLISYGIGCHTT